jgi:hypothetical protein
MVHEVDHCSRRYGGLAGLFSAGKVELRAGAYGRAGNVSIIADTGFFDLRSSITGAGLGTIRRF